MKKKIKDFRNGIFSLRTNFGKLAQLMIKKDKGFLPSDDKSYDLKDKEGHRIEVKFSRAYKKNIVITESNVIELCTYNSIGVYRSSEAENKSSDYDCNIQQIKPDCFDYLYYGVFWDDRIDIFCIERSEFPIDSNDFKKNNETIKKKIPGYAHQHKSGEDTEINF